MVQVEITIRLAYQAGLLKQLGYDCYMIFVNTSLEVALERNKKEKEVPENILQLNHGKVFKHNIGKFQNLFGLGNMVIVDNSKDDRELTTITMNKVDKAVRGLLKNKVKSYTAKDGWLQKEKQDEDDKL